MNGAIDFNQLSQDLQQATGLNNLFLPGPASNVYSILSLILRYVYVIAGLILLFYLISGGFSMMTNPTDEKALTAAKAKLTNALFGFLLLFLSYWIVQIIEVILGISIF